MILSPSNFLTASLGSVSGTGENCSVLILLQDHDFHASLLLLSLRVCSFWWAPLYFPMLSARASLILCLAPRKLSIATGKPSFRAFWPWIFWTHVRFFSWHSGEWVSPRKLLGTLAGSRMTFLIPSCLHQGLFDPLVSKPIACFCFLSFIIFPHKIPLTQSSLSLRSETSNEPKNKPLFHLLKPTVNMMTSVSLPGGTSRAPTDFGIGAWQSWKKYFEAEIQT